MKKFLIVVMAVVMCGVAHAGGAEFDTSDPMFIQAPQEFLSKSNISYGDSILRLGQDFSYGVIDRFVLGVNLHYQNDFAGDEDGFSSFDIGGVYRLVGPDTYTSHVMTDVLFGFKVGGTERVRTPWFADSTYYAGLRVGRVWDTLTLAGTVKSSWIFDDLRGMSYIDFILDAYFRLRGDWRLGFGTDMRKATNSYYDQQWINTKLVRQYGRTQYIGHMDYEFEDEEFQIGAKLNILF